MSTRKPDLLGPPKFGGKDPVGTYYEKMGADPNHWRGITFRPLSSPTDSENLDLGLEISTVKTYPTTSGQPDGRELYWTRAGISFVPESCRIAKGIQVEFLLQSYGAGIAEDSITLDSDDRPGILGNRSFDPKNFTRVEKEIHRRLHAKLENQRLGYACPVRREDCFPGRVLELGYKDVITNAFDEPDPEQNTLHNLWLSLDAQDTESCVCEFWNTEYGVHIAHQPDTGLVRIFKVVNGRGPEWIAGIYASTRTSVTLAPCLEDTARHRLQALEVLEREQKAKRARVRRAAAKKA